MPPKPSDLIASQEACAILGIDRSSLVRLAQLKRLRPALKLPGPRGAYLYRRGDVEALAAERASAAAAEVEPANGTPA